MMMVTMTLPRMKVSDFMELTPLNDSVHLTMYEGSSNPPPGVIFDLTPSDSLQKALPVHVGNARTP